MPADIDVGQLVTVILWAGFFWLAGRYLQAWDRRRGRVFVPAPTWFNRLCGSPRSDGRLSPGWAYMQIMSILMIALELVGRLLSVGPKPIGLVWAVTMFMQFVGTGALVTWQEGVVEGRLRRPR